MKLIIMRHGQAEWSAPSDAERALTAIGQIQVQTAARILKARYDIARILTSPYLRAQQTAEHVASELGCPVETLEGLVPEGNASVLINHLPENENVLLASHMPLVSDLTGLLCEGAVNAGPSFHTGAAAVIEYDVLGIGAGQLVDMVVP